ncbi:proteasome subunit alpha [Allonocardiopsis opalescens]|uniref:Proteasome subunit alpha n=1 Tax=Allonocardiopsis opalescens TaxID=1144618 RepID=A0A2T0PTW9_9ACTN|nr:proteasome subunit alpha [Allonocardiopsis opalescens]PRX92347.1 proteasome alpha subunit [Allonocardiopsis opalescens]
MSVPFYVSPEQISRDKADYARKGIARGRSAVVLQYDDGILFVADNVSRTLHKISEIYDRIAFAAVGRYNEFENLRLAGVRFADLHGYTYDRSDVSGRALANAYAQTLGNIFSETNKPYEVEIVVAEVGDSTEGDQIYRVTFDGSVVDERDHVVMGGSADRVAGALRDRYEQGAGLAAALQAAVHALAFEAEEERQLEASSLEVAVLDRNREHRMFQRITGRRLTELLGRDGGGGAPEGGSEG